MRLRTDGATSAILAWRQVIASTLTPDERAEFLHLPPAKRRPLFVLPPAMKTYVSTLVLATLLLTIPAMSFADHSETAPHDAAEMYGEIAVTTGAETSEAPTPEPEVAEEQTDDETNLLISGPATAAAIAVIGGGLWYVMKRKA